MNIHFFSPFTLQFMYSTCSFWWKHVEEFVFLIGWNAHIKEILVGTLLPAISCTKNNFYIPPLKNYINNSPGGGKMRLALNFSPRRIPGPALHVLVVRGQLCFLAEAELIQLNWKRHGLAFFFCVHGGHRAKRWTLSLCHSVNRASVS